MSETTEATPQALANEADIREALRQVEDPEIHIDVVSLGLIREVDVNTDPIMVNMLLTTPFCPYGPWLVQQVTEKAEEAAGRPVKVEVLPEQWRPDMAEDPGLLGFDEGMFF